MKTLYWLPLAALAAFAADCGDITDPVDSDLDTDTTFQGDFLITSLNLGCAPGVAPAEDVITHDVTFQGWADTVTVEIVNSGFTGGDPWDETHVMPADANISFAADGTSDTWQFTLDDVDSTGAVVLGSTTLMGCGGADGDNFFDQENGEFKSIAVKVSGTPDSDANEPDCAIYGYNSRATFGPDCICFEQSVADGGSNCEDDS
jgi:hypothetical protein